MKKNKNTFRLMLLISMTIYLNDCKISAKPHNEFVRIDESKSLETFLKEAFEADSLENYNKELELLNITIKEYPKSDSAYARRSRVKLILKDTVGAFADVERAIKINPKSNYAYFRRGVINEKLKKYKEAIEDYNKAIVINPKSDYAYFNRGFSKGNLEDYRGAIADYTKAIELNPNFAVAYLYRGISKIGINQKDSACLDFSKAGELGYADAYETIEEYCN